METTLYKITFKDGRLFKVFCANKAQKDRFIRTVPMRQTDKIKDVEVFESGIHNIKQWEKIIKTIR